MSRSSRQEQETTDFMSVVFHFFPKSTLPEFRRAERAGFNGLLVMSKEMYHRREVGGLFALL